MAVERVLLTIPEAAEYLNVSKAWFYRHVYRDVPVVKPTGGVVRISRKALDAWIAAQEVQPLAAAR